MVDLLVRIRMALDELAPLLHGRVVDIEMPRLAVGADADRLQRTLVTMIGRAIESYEGGITVRTTRRGAAARIEVLGEQPRPDLPGASWPATLVSDVEALDGQLGETEAGSVWLSLPLAGPGTADA